MLRASSISCSNAMPVEIIIGIFFDAQYFNKGKLVKSSDPTFIKSIFFISNIKSKSVIFCGVVKLSMPMSSQKSNNSFHSFIENSYRVNMSSWDSVIVFPCDL